jgi:hypothetical protein
VKVFNEVPITNPLIIFIVASLLGFVALFKEPQPLSAQSTSKHPSDLSIAVLSPNGGEEWVVGKTYEIKWKIGEYSYDHVTIYLINDDLYSNPIVIQSSIPNTGTYQWTIPKSLPIQVAGGSESKVEIISSKNYRILVQNTRTGESDFSDEPFTIVTSNSASNQQKCYPLYAVKFSLGGPGYSGSLGLRQCGNLASKEYVWRRQHQGDNVLPSSYWGA